MVSLTTIIGRGHGGTRAISHTLSKSEVYMGNQLNKSGDLVPADEMYEACRVMAKHVIHQGGVHWNFDALHSVPIDPSFIRLVESYLSSVLASDAEHRGWKLPETTLIFPWIVRMFPEINYIHWIRDPRDSIAGSHITDNLSDFGVPCDQTHDTQLSRAVSWKYQVEIVRATPKPARWIQVRLEDFILDNEQTLLRLERYLGFKLTRIPVHPEVIGRWRESNETCSFDFFADDLLRFGYEPQRR